MHLSSYTLSAFAGLCVLGSSLPTAMGVESFEKVKRGKFTSLQTEYGTLTCGDSVAEIGGSGKSGNASLRMFGGDNTELRLSLKTPPTREVALAAWGERWSGQAPFDFRIVAVGPSGEKEIYDGKQMKTGGFNTQIKAKVPAGTKELIFKLTSPENKGVKLDDLYIVPAIPMKIEGSTLEQNSAVYPVYVRMEDNPILSLKVTTEGCEKPLAVTAVGLDFSGTTKLADIESVTVYNGGEKPKLIEGPVIFPEGDHVLGTYKMTPTNKGKVTVTGNLPLDPGDNYLWVSVKMRDGASIDGRVVCKPVGVKAGKYTLKPANTEPVAQRIGVAIVKPGDFNSKFYRIPGMVRSKKGTLVAVYDIRYNHAGDLPANIDVGVSRSKDGGRTWSPTAIAIDDSKIDAKFSDARGVGDPAILVDNKTGRLWTAALWSYRHSLSSTQAGDNSPEKCGQLVLAYSDDDGVTWSKPINITEQTKDLGWKILFNGPGAGICMQDGTLVFAAQYWAGDGKPWSTIVYSKDGGKTWHCGTGVNEQTTEAQVIELADGSIMINARCNWGGSRVVGVTKDLGKTWTKHSTNRGALREPVCQGSILAVNNVPSAGRVVFFSNPDSTNARALMTIKASKDDATTWPENSQVLYDTRNGWGYSCLAPVDKNHVGVLYEGKGPLYFLKIPYKEILNKK